MDDIISAEGGGWFQPLFQPLFTSMPGDTTFSDTCLNKSTNTSKPSSSSLGGRGFTNYSRLCPPLSDDGGGGSGGCCYEDFENLFQSRGHLFHCIVRGQGQLSRL